MTNSSSTPKLNASARIMYETAVEMGIVCQALDDHETIFMHKNGRQWYTRGSRTSAQSSVGRTIANDKLLTKQVLHNFNLPTADHVVIKDPSDLAAVARLRFPVVAKPSSGAHGRHVHSHLKNVEEVAAALAADSDQRDGDWIIESMLSGTEYRIVCVGFKFVAAAFRKPAHVVGDGHGTIQELIDQKNQHPWRKTGHEGNLTTISVDEAIQKFLQQQQLSLDSIPELGREVALRRTANLSTGGEAWDVTDQVSAHNRRVCEQIAKACDLSIVGIDLMCESLTTDLESQPAAGVIEVNGSPGLRMHHFPLQGEPRPVAETILQYTLSQL